MNTQIERLRQEMRMESRKFTVQIILAFAAAISVGIAIGHFWMHG